MRDEGLTRFSESDRTSEEGIIFVSGLVNRLGWIWREVLKHDVGIDGYIEIVEEAEATHRLIEVQVKSGESYIRQETQANFRFTTDAEHLKYWMKSAIPVIIVVYSPTKQVGYWVHVQSLRLELRDASGSISFDFPKEPFDVTARGRLTELPLDAGSRPVPLRIQTLDFAESGGEKKYPMIPVILSGETGATSTLGLVDSGSEYLIIPTKLAEYLSLKKEDLLYVDFPGGREQVRTASVDLRLPGGEPMPAKCIIAGSAPSVILGRSPLFDEHRVTVDYRRGTVSFEPYR